MPLRPCLDCGVIGQGSRCPQHQAAFNTRRNARRPANSVRRPDYTSAERRRRERTVEAHRAEHGEWCPGWGVPAHDVIAPNKLTADHVVSVKAGGREDGPLTTLCVSCNARKADH